MKKAGLSSMLFAATLLTVGVITQAQQPKKVPRIGYLYQGDRISDSDESLSLRS